MKEILMKRLNCSEKEADMLAADIEELSPKFREAMDAWIEEGTIDTDIEAEGFSAEKLMKEYDMQFTGAVLTLDWLVKDPVTAKKALAYGIR